MSRNKRITRTGAHPSRGEGGVYCDVAADMPEQSASRLGTRLVLRLHH